VKNKEKLAEDVKNLKEFMATFGATGAELSCRVF
jgi:tRNA nucleotidyltransferase (CCA-adding enzyme)